MFKQILVPLDGSLVAECVFPHVLSLSTALGASVTLLHVLERPRNTGTLEPVDPLRWTLKKQAAEKYLRQQAACFKEAGLEVECDVQEGFPAETILHHSNLTGADLIVLSTHGSSGLSGWNVSSVVQKIILRANKSILLVRAYRSPGEAEATGQPPYRRIFVGLDGSARAELVLPLAVWLAEHYRASLTLGMVVQKPEILSRLPLSGEDEALVEQVTQWNRQAAMHYLDQVRGQLACSGVEVDTRMATSTHVLSTLHTMVEEEGADLMMLVAHGRSAQGCWPYGSVTTSFIAYGSTSLFIMQDLSAGELQQSTAELAMLQTQGH